MNIMEEKETVTPAEDKVDYKAELAKALEDNAKKDREINQARFTIKKNKIEDKKSKTVFSKKDEDDDEPELPDIDEVDEKIKAALNDVKAEEFLHKYSLDDDEIELAKFHLQNTIKPSGNAEYDATAALAIANQKTIAKKYEEMKTAFLNKQPGSASQATGGATREVPLYGGQLTPQQIATLKSVHGFNDKQIQMFIEKRQGIKHEIKP